MSVAPSAPEAARTARAPAAQGDVAARGDRAAGFGAADPPIVRQAAPRAVTPGRASSPDLWLLTAPGLLVLLAGAQFWRRRRREGPEPVSATEPAPRPPSEGPVGSEPANPASVEAELQELLAEEHAATLLERERSLSSV